jgi:hypothetical protein
MSEPEEKKGTIVFPPQPEFTRTKILFTAAETALEYRFIYDIPVEIHCPRVQRVLDPSLIE